MEGKLFGVTRRSLIEFSPFHSWLNGDCPKARPDYVYVASSWRNLLQQDVVGALRSAGIDCYDFKAAKVNSWREIDGDVAWLQTPEQWRSSLGHWFALGSFGFEKCAMDKCDCGVLVLPCGRSAHLEAGYLAGQGKPVFTLAVEKCEPELMSLLLGPPEFICTSVVELLGKLGVED